MATHRLLAILAILLASALLTGACGTAATHDHEGHAAVDDDAVDDDAADDDAVDDDAADDDTTPDLPQWLLDRPYLQDRSLWAEDIDMTAPWVIRRLGPIGVGNGRVFGLLGNQYPLATWHNLGGPTYQKNTKWFSDKGPFLFGDDRPRSSRRESISYVRHAPIVIVTARDRELEWTSVNFAPRGTNAPAAEEALISVWIVRNISARPIEHINLEMMGVLGGFRDGQLVESDLGGDFLYQRPLEVAATVGPRKDDMLIPFGALAPGEERVVTAPLAFVKGKADPSAVFAAITQNGVDALLEATVAWWNDWAAQITQVDTPDPRYNELLDALALSIKVNQASTGGLTEMSQYSYTWLRDTHGVSILLPLIGLGDDYRDMLNYLYGVIVLNGNLGNALPIDADVSNLPPPPDWRNLGEFTGRTRAEGPSFFVLEYENYYKATGDLATLTERYDLLWHALVHQQFVDGCLQYFSSDETFEDVMQASFGENILNEPDESLLSSYSSFAMIRAARFMAGLAALLNKTDDAAMFTQLVDNFITCLNDTFWMPDKGFYAVQADTATRVPFPLPYEDVDTMPLWLDVFDRGDPQVVENFETIMRLLGHANGTLYSHIAPVYDWIFPQVNVGVQTGMSHGYWLVNLDKMFHPKADEAFRRLIDVVTPTGFTDEALIVDDYSHLSLLREPFGIDGDTSARFRSWEAGIIGHAMIFHLTGYDYDLVAGTASLAPHLPPEWGHVTLTSLSYGDGRFDLDVRRDKGHGRQITITTDAQTSFVLSLTVPLDGAFQAATINGQSASPTAATNAYGRTVVRFAPFAVPAGETTVIVVSAQ